MKKGPRIIPLAPAHLAWAGAVQLSLAALVYDAALAAVPLGIFLLITFAAPFLPRFSYFLPIVSKGKTKEKLASLTFDDGPDPRSTVPLLHLLDRHGVKAAFFLTGRRAARHPELVREIVRRGHPVGNHSYSHDPFLMLRGTARLRDEIRSAQEILCGFGVTPLAFRPPVGITTPRLWRVLLDMGMYCMNFSNRPADFGNRRITGLARRVMRKLAPGDLILLHDRCPGDEQGTRSWLDEIEKIITGARSRGYSLIPPDVLCERPVCRYDSCAPEAISSFYDSLARTYDREQADTAVSIVRDTELRLFQQNRDELFGPDMSVLELGAGTGLFTGEIARLCRDVTAVDISGDMLKILEQKAAEKGISNITTVRADFQDFASERIFDAVCSFSALEYVTDLDSFFRSLQGLLKPGGIVYITTSHASFIKFFAQIGNAMRQGLWLHARTKRKLCHSLLKAGLEPLKIHTHGCKIPVIGGLIVEILAVKPGG
ncbi:MAG TPA: polysaccharide deacetylase family protein [Spirochaetota bacterium]|nr:polysaccharide deacetylase family protein [Spirochaetota bacterium]HPI87704.1 polysaccharide deacetylase family protein [Spirochaetota bacterium]HPR48171.1 polysaccharide deacetylase family protein [Spirochaetota bacterium]